MFTKISKERLLVAGISVMLVGTSLPVNALSTKGLLDNIEIINERGGNSTYKPTQFDNLKENGVSLKPVTWGDYLASISGQDKEEGDIDISKGVVKVLNENKKNQLPLVMTKSQIYNATKLLLESNKEQKLDLDSEYRLMSSIFSLSPNRNYLVSGDLDYIVDRMKYTKVEDGVLHEIALGRVLQEYPTRLRVEIIGESGLTNRSREWLQIDPNNPWKRENKIYELTLKGDQIVSLEPKHDLKYGLVEGKGIGKSIGEVKVTKGIVNAGDYVEYIELDGEATVLKNLGTGSTQIVRSIYRNRIATVEGTVLRDDTKFIDKDGNEVNPQHLEPLDAITLFDNDIAIVENSGQGTEETIAVLAGDRVQIGDKVYNSEDILITDSRKVETLKDFEYSEYLKKGKVKRGVDGKPRLIEVDPTEKVLLVTRVKDDKVKGYIEGEEKEIDLGWDINSRKLYEDEVYSVVIVEDKMMEYSKLRTTSVETSHLNSNWIKVSDRRSRNYFVEGDTPVRELNKGKGEDKDRDRDRDSYDLTTYKDLYDNYEDSIENGYMELELWVNGDNVEFIEVRYNYKEGMNKDNWLESTPLDLYKLEKIDIKGLALELSDGESTVKFTLEDTRNNKTILEDIKNEDYIRVKFDGDGNIDEIRLFELTDENIKTKGLAEYLKLNEGDVTDLWYSKGSEELAKIRKEYRMFSLKDEKTFIQTPITTELKEGEEYYILRKGKIARVVIIEGGE